MASLARGWVARALLAATVVSLVVTVLAGYLTRLAIVEATAWVTHTADVKLALAEGEDRSALARVSELTRDNDRQQSNVSVARATTDASAAAGVMATMQSEEDRLMTVRASRIETERGRSALAFVVAAFLTVAGGMGSIWMFREQRQALARQRKLLEAIVECVDEGVVAVSTSREMIVINAAARAMWGSSAPSDRWVADWRNVLRATYEDGTDMEPDVAPLARALRGETSKNVVYRLTGASSDAPGIWVSASARPIADEHGETMAAVTTLRDITTMRARTEPLRDESMTDALTGLLNRRGFVELATAQIEKARASREPIALLFADVNGLKRINDELGHEQGDAVIRDAAVALGQVLRAGDIVARIGGDELVALLPDRTPASSGALLDRLAAAIRGHNDGAKRSYRLSVSSAIAHVDWERDASLETLLAEADRAMYERKRERAGLSVPPRS
jgi:diguanylate cyclase (GGDEF)-like protein